jgi:hypothetical protein
VAAVIAASSALVKAARLLDAGLPVTFLACEPAVLAEARLDGCRLALGRGRLLVLLSLRGLSLRGLALELLTR